MTHLPYDQLSPEQQAIAKARFLDAATNDRYVYAIDDQGVPFSRRQVIRATREAVEKLKADWCADPCFDLEQVADEPEFEPYRQELADYQASKEAEWAARRVAALRERAAKAGLSPEALQEVERLESVSARHSANASKLLVHYFSMATVPQRVCLTDDNVSEINSLADAIVDAAVAKVAAVQLRQSAAGKIPIDPSRDEGATWAPSTR